MTERKSLPLMRTVVAVLAAGVMLLLVYVVGYFWLGTKNVLKGDGPVPGSVPVVTGVVRLYPQMAGDCLSAGRLRRIAVYRSSGLFGRLRDLWRSQRR